jgi:hypothetical protein
MSVEAMKCVSARRKSDNDADARFVTQRETLSFEFFFLISSLSRFPALDCGKKNLQMIYHCLSSY